MKQTSYTLSASSSITDLKTDVKGLKTRSIHHGADRIECIKIGAQQLLISRTQKVDELRTSKVKACAEIF